MADAAIAYLAASGAGAISVTADHNGAAIATGYNVHFEEVVETFWLPPGRARPVAARARHIARKNPEVDDAITAVREAAAKSRV
jgi:hypothetical protein